LKQLITVGLIFGGCSAEHDVSILSAKAIAQNINRSCYDVVPVYVDKCGKWYITNETLEISKLDEQQVWLSMDPERPGLKMENDGGVFIFPIDVFFPIIHGPYGEDGHLQGLLKISGIPFVGSGVASSVIGMDKEYMKMIFKKESIPVVDYLVFRNNGDWNMHKAITSVEETFGFPCFVKPCNMGSSIGVTKVSDSSKLQEAIEVAFTHDRKVIVEKAVNAREIECAILGDNEPKASVLGEIIPNSEFYSYNVKYYSDQAKLIIGADLDPGISDKIREIAVRVHKTIGCYDFSRVDFFLDKESDAVWVNEINTVPGFTDKSMYFKLWEATGLNFGELIDRLIHLTLERETMNRSMCIK